MMPKCPCEEGKEAEAEERSHPDDRVGGAERAPPQIVVCRRLHERVTGRVSGTTEESESARYRDSEREPAHAREHDQ